MCPEQHSSRVESAVASGQARPCVERVDGQLLQLRSCNSDQIRDSVSVFDRDWKGASAFSQLMYVGEGTVEHASLSGVLLVGERS